MRPVLAAAHAAIENWTAEAIRISIPQSRARNISFLVLIETLI